MALRVYDNIESTRKAPRKLVMSPSDSDDEATEERAIPPKSEPKSESRQETKTKTEDSKKEKAKTENVETKESEYAYNILKNEILQPSPDRVSKMDLSSLSEDELRLYKVVQHLINEGFIDEMELLQLAERRNEIQQNTKSEFDKFEKENVRKHNNNEFDMDALNKWRNATISEMDENVINHKNIMSEPLIVSTKQFAMNRRDYSDPLSALESDSVFELQLDDRDLKHILLYLIYNHLHTKKFYELNPSIKELAYLLYGIRTQNDFNRLLNAMSRTRKQIESIMQSYPLQSTPNILVQYDKTSDLEYSADGKDAYKYDEYSQNVEQTQRNMTSYELDATIKRIQDLEFRQFGYTVPQKKALASSDDDMFINIVQDEEETEEAAELAKQKELTQEIKDGDEVESGVEIEDDADAKQKGYYQAVMDRVQHRWNGDLMDMNQIGGDWRVRLGIAERQIDTDFDVEEEVEKQWKRQLNESIAYSTRKKYKMSPWKIRSLPFADSKDLKIDFMNVELLTKFVNDRGMILPRRFTGVDKMAQKKLAKAIKRARKIGLLPHMSKLLILDEKKIKKMKQELEIKKKIQSERDEYDLMNVSDLKAMYPEYAPEGDEQNRVMNEEGDDLKIDFNAEYEIEENELFYQTQLRKQQNLFMKQIKQNIIKQIPEYWQKRLSFRDKSNVLVNEMHNRDKQKNRQRNQGVLAQKLND